MPAHGTLAAGRASLRPPRHDLSSGLHRSAKAPGEEFETSPFAARPSFAADRAALPQRRVRPVWRAPNLFLFRDYPVMLINILAGPRAPEAPGKPH
jgi:hypothetical protein